MRAQLGYATLAIGTAAAVLGVITLAAESEATGPRCCAWRGRYVWVVLFASVGAFVVMEWAMFAHDYSIEYVADNVANAQRPVSTRSPRGGARSKDRSCCGCSSLSVYIVVTTWRFRKRARHPLVVRATIVQYVVVLASSSG